MPVAWRNNPFHCSPEFAPFRSAGPGAAQNVKPNHRANEESDHVDSYDSGALSCQCNHAPIAGTAGKEIDCKLSFMVSPGDQSERTLIKGCHYDVGTGRKRGIVEESCRSQVGGFLYG